MPRPAGPWWWKARGCWTATIDGKRNTEKTGIGQHEKPMRHRVPVRVWDWWEALRAEKTAEEIHPDELTVAGLAGRYLAWVKREVEAGRMTQGTFTGHRTKLGRFCSFRPVGQGRPLGTKPAREVTATDLDAAVQHWQVAGRRDGTPFRPNYVRGLIRAIQAAYSWAERPVAGRIPERLLGASPLAKYRAPGVPRSPNRYLEAERFRAFLRWGWRRARAIRKRKRLTHRFDRVYILMLQFLRHTGTRPGEACNLEWGDILWDERYAILPPERWKSGRKTGRPREIPLNGQAMRILRVLHRQTWRHTTHVFAHRRGKNATDRGATAEQGEPWNSTAAGKKLRDWRGWAAADGIDIETKGPLKVVAYVARHTYISDGLMTGQSSEMMASSTGTSTQMIESTYGHVQRKSKRSVADELAEKRRKL